MNGRFDYRTASPAAYEAMLGLEHFVRNVSGLEMSLVELVKVRASQINGCAFCLDMHTREAREQGESEQRLHLVAAWQHAPCFSRREKAALAWTEALTTLSAGPPDDALFEKVAADFTPAELVNLTIVCNTINGWNRLAVAFQQQPEAVAPSEVTPR